MPINRPPKTLQRAMLVAGTLLFGLGLLSGLVTQVATNPRMALSAHLQGLTNGMFLIAVGAAWTHLKLGPGLLRLTFALLVFGTYANWLATSLAAFWNTGEMTPIHGPEPTAQPWQESIVSGGLLALTLSMLLGTALLVYGFAKSRQ